MNTFSYLKRNSLPPPEFGPSVSNPGFVPGFGQTPSPYITLTASSPNTHQNPQLPQPARTRIWVKRPGGNATTMFVGPGDLVDDVKSQIMLKFPTTLAQQFDPSELILKLEIPSQSSPVANSFNLQPHQPPREHTYQGSPLASQPSSLPPKTLMSRSSSTNLSNKVPKLRQTGSVAEMASLHTIPVSPIPIPASKSSLLNHPEPSIADRIPEPSSHKPSPLNQLRNQARPRTTTIVLEPDAFIMKIVDQYFPGGMKVEDSFIIDTPYPVAEKRPGPVQYRQTTDTTSFVQPSAAGSGSFNSEIAKDSANAPAFFNGPPTGRSNQARTPQDPVSPENSYTSKVAILGEQSLPPPRDITRFGKGSVHENGQSSSTVILFPRGTRNGSKSPSSQHSNNTGTPGRTPTFDEPASADTAEKSSEVSETTSASVKSLSSKKGPKKEDVASALKIKQQPKPGINKILTNINVLVIEDNLVNQKIMARHLKSCNVHFKIATNGEEGLEMWREGGFHLCFMDIQLPVISGIEVTEEIRRLERLNRIGNFANLAQANEPEELTASDRLDHNLFRSPIIIVALTASTSAADKQQALAAGCNDYLTKPVQLKWLRNKLTDGYTESTFQVDGEPFCSRAKAPGSARLKLSDFLETRECNNVSRSEYSGEEFPARYEFVPQHSKCSLLICFCRYVKSSNTSGFSYWASSDSTNKYARLCGVGGVEKKMSTSPRSSILCPDLISVNMYLKILNCDGTNGVMFHSANFLSSFTCLDVEYFQQQTQYLTTTSMNAPIKMVGIPFPGLVTYSDSTSFSIRMPYDIRNMRGLLNFCVPREFVRSFINSIVLDAVSSDELSRLSLIMVRSFSYSTTELSGLIGSFGNSMSTESSLLSFPSANSWIMSSGSSS
ncbi:hypothetical protein OGAPHI_001415 [Ogataea philodendri]|uniref:Response regulatory domain-containing protein n=1 Tax=Ogataea philodendri TaxID=1378263 RepID=A0A9P8PD70_9ASCO|nr:uncharacterized protein OGAPHI_001415 [Ogataea philodendri]KAH3669294.1 hypothetical protein OGAPHI_001415 [Ogataea philodendri]